ncbi:MAG: hypothetical protein ACPGNV_01890 [Mangrovicoccus sp.]
MRVPMLTPNFWVAASTLLAALFVAVQAWYARVAFVEASSTRLLQARLDACFDNYDAASALDAELRSISGDPDAPEAWPARVVPLSPAQGVVVHNQILPAVERLEASLMKSSILGPLGKERDYLLQHISGLGQRIRLIPPSQITRQSENSDLRAVFASLSEFIGAQHLILLGCRKVTERTG